MKLISLALFLIAGNKDDCHGVELWGGTEPSDAEGGG